jgi:riboflavin synthase
MFTGIIEEMGKLKNLKQKGEFYNLAIESKKIITKVNIGESIAVDGICLTLKERGKNLLYFDLIKETYQNTRFRYLRIGELLNLETSLKIGDSISGHFISGHIDCIADVTNVKKKRETAEIEIKIPNSFLKLIVLKGSIAVNGVSLTIQEIIRDKIKIGIIPYTFENTNLSLLKTGKKVNIEFDILAKYVANYLREDYSDFKKRLQRLE